MIHIIFSLGFLRRNRRKDKKKKSASGKDEDGGEGSVKDIGSDGEDVHKSETPTPEVLKIKETTLRNLSVT